ncbi:MULTISPECIES: hypothetical protein [Pseudomonas]|uniref:Proline utilization regulator n=1 Tax=Pseudomonas luteola TaxID=47886 RepID=A0A2X2ET14_PSELU|nr:MULTISPECIES: hypothetical protein [Pseudomonas]ENA30578.1 hypothetical protein HMPREF1487_07478 [Pseudomonas sp. HPB0071]MBF8642931.1 hypothetical protein [Pseudomonas zeshuii]RRW43903.1 hypothetical protein EGJ50_18175 [Pseudomonas luteola]SHJ44903.1 hypothetical protein SAMN05216295_1146 [Pseudomonas zeshuii]SPZ09700.1 proline utilization regulator [Pseudomonas luteola]
MPPASLHCSWERVYAFARLGDNQTLIVYLDEDDMTENVSDVMERLRVLARYPAPDPVFNTCCITPVKNCSRYGNDQPLSKALLTGLLQALYAL